MEQEIKMSITALVGLISLIVGPIIAALVYMYKQRENTQKEILSLTKTFTESTMSHKQVLENNTSALNEVKTVIKELPDQIMLHAAAARKQ
jgi:hypothetical protein